MRKLVAVGTLCALSWLPAQTAFAGWDEGVAAFKAGNYSKAAQEFETLAQQRPDCVQCYLMLGQSLLKLKRGQEAVTQLRKAYDLAPNDDSIRMPLAQAYVQARRYDDAVKLLNTINPASLPKAKQQVFYQLRAAALDKSGRGDQALADLRSLAQANPRDAAAQYTYGLAALAARETAAAITALDAAVKLDARDADKKRSLVRAYMLQGRQAQGATKARAYQQATEVATALVATAGNFDNLMLLGEAQLGAKQYAAAAGTFQRAKAANANDWLALFYLGQAQTATGQFAQAEASLNAALGKAKAGQEQTMTWRQLAFVYEKQKKPAEAIAAYRRIGDQASITRIEQNKAIADENAEIESYNRQVQELEEQRRRLEAEMKDLPPNF
jgi:tetratricopeptide (TPR) repeat protein